MNFRMLLFMILSLSAGLIMLIGLILQILYIIGVIK